MHKLFIFFLCSLSLTAMANTKSEDMLTILNDAGVSTWGRRQWQEANFKCRIPHFGQDKSLKCVLRANNLDLDGGIYKVFTGEEAKFISNLLEEFKVLPYGKYMYQEAAIQCYLKKPKLSDEKECDTVDYDSMSMP